MNPALQAALAAAKDKQNEIERQFGPPRPQAPYQVPQQTEEQQEQAKADMDMMKQQLLVYLFEPLPDITVQELAAVVAFALRLGLAVNPAGQSLDDQLGKAARHFVLKG